MTEQSKVGGHVGGVYFNDVVHSSPGRDSEDSHTLLRHDLLRVLTRARMMGYVITVDTVSHLPHPKTGHYDIHALIRPARHNYPTDR